MSAVPAFVPSDPEGTVWDVVVIGTGMGGATAGFELARAGHRVLFIEKGPLSHSAMRSGIEVPRSPESGSVEDESAARLRSGSWPHRATVDSNLGKLNFFLPLGCGSGGTSTFYAAGLERFWPSDFSPRASFPDVADSSLPERWPITYQDLAPFYSRAEALYRVRGSQDSLHGGSASALEQPPPLSARDQHFEESFRSLGLHPYRLHVGCAFVEGCEGCPHGPCARGCKSDSAWICLMPALDRYGAKILPECEAIRIDAGSDSVRNLECRSATGPLRIRARYFVLAAGALMSPVLLLKSKSADWPEGLANKSGLVGRNLMFHGGDIFAVSPLHAVDGAGPRKTLAINDFYHASGTKLGTFQTLGVDLEMGRIMQYLRDTAESSTAWWRWVFAPRPAWWKKLTSPAVRFAAMVGYHLLNFKNAAIWVSILEDLPYSRNRVVPDPGDPNGVRIEYQYSDELKRRVILFRKLLAKAIGKHRVLVLSAANTINYPHVCGTCRFGDDENQSVLDRNNRAHGVKNLFVVDASFFPSSGGTNPSLTIAANALRVAEVIDRELGSKAKNSPP